jgi:hypothetical protein
VKSFFAETLLVAFALPAFAGSQTYKCDFWNNAQSRAVGGPFHQSLVQVNWEAGTALVYDGYTKVAYGRTVSAKMRQKGSGLYRARWRVRGLPGKIIRSSEGSYNVTTETNNITGIFWLEFGADMTSVRYFERVGSGTANKPAVGACKPLPGGIERYINP